MQQKTQKTHSPLHDTQPQKTRWIFQQFPCHSNNNSNYVTLDIGNDYPRYDCSILKYFDLLVLDINCTKVLPDFISFRCRRSAMEIGLYTNRIHVYFRF